MSRNTILGRGGVRLPAVRISPEELASISLTEDDIRRLRTFQAHMTADGFWTEGISASRSSPLPARTPSPAARASATRSSVTSLRSLDHWPARSSEKPAVRGRALADQLAEQSSTATSSARSPPAPAVFLNDAGIPVPTPSELNPAAKPRSKKTKSSPAAKSTKSPTSKPRKEGLTKASSDPFLATTSNPPRPIPTKKRSSIKTSKKEPKEEQKKEQKQEPEQKPQKEA